MTCLRKDVAQGSVSLSEFKEKREHVGQRQRLEATKAKNFPDLKMQATDLRSPRKPHMALFKCLVSLQNTRR